MGGNSLSLDEPTSVLTAVTEVETLVEDVLIEMEVSEESPRVADDDWTETTVAMVDDWTLEVEVAVGVTVTGRIWRFSIVAKEEQWEENKWDVNNIFSMLMES